MITDPACFEFNQIILVNFFLILMEHLSYFDSQANSSLGPCFLSRDYRSVFSGSCGLIGWIRGFPLLILFPSGCSNSIDASYRSQLTIMGILFDPTGSAENNQPVDATPRKHDTTPSFHSFSHRILAECSKCGIPVFSTFIGG